MIMKLGYGFTDKGYVLDGEGRRPVIDTERSYIPGFTEKYPLSSKGQAEFVKNDPLVHAIISNNKLKGFSIGSLSGFPAKGFVGRASQGRVTFTRRANPLPTSGQISVFNYKGEVLPAFDEFSL